MRYQEIITEFISTPLSKNIRYDAKNNRLDFDNGDVRPRLMLKHVRKMKILRRIYLKKHAQVRELRALMYGGGVDAKRAEVEAAQAELEAIQSQIANEIQVAELEQVRKGKLTQQALRFIKKH